MNKLALTSLMSFALTSGQFLLSSTAPVQAFTTYFGEDLNNSDTVPLPSFPNADAAQADFLDRLNGVGTENFQGFDPDTEAPSDDPLKLTFPGSLNQPITALLSSDEAAIVEIPAGETDGFGRYGSSPTKYFDVGAGVDFVVEFEEEEIAAFGFYGIDIGDFDGQVMLEVETINGPQMLIIPHSTGDVDGSVLFYGFIADNPSERFTSVHFLTTSGEEDFFAFDDFTIGDWDQIDSGPGPDPDPNVPEPSTVLGLLIIGGLGLLTKQKQK